MNPVLEIKVNAKNRAATVATGMVTVGALVDVRVSGLDADGIPDWGDGDKWTGKSLRLRVVDPCGRDLARFPLADGDAWTVDDMTEDEDGGSGALTATVDFGTDRLRAALQGVPFDEGMTFGLILDSSVDKAQYAVGTVTVGNWVPASYEDPTILPDWRDTLKALTEKLDAVETARDEAQSAADEAEANAAIVAGHIADANAAVEEAKSQAAAAGTAQNNAETARDEAESAAHEAATYSEEAAASEQAAKDSEIDAAASAGDAVASAEEAKGYAANAKTSEDNAASAASEAAKTAVEEAMSEVKSLKLDTSTVAKMRRSLIALAKALGVASATMLMLTCGAAEVEKQSLNELNLDDDPQVVTDVSFSGLATEAYVADAVKNAKVSTDGLVTSNDLAAALASAVPGDYANVSNRAVHAVQAEADPIFAAWTNGDSVALGNKATASKDVGATALGSFAKATGESSVAIGYDAKANGLSSVAIGDGSTAVGAGAVALGYSAYASNSFGVAVSPDKFVFGASADRPGKSLQSYLDECGKVKSVNGATGDVEVTAAGIGAATKNAVAEVSQSVGEVWTYLKGDNFRVVVTNYDSAVNPARTRYEYRMTTNEAWKVVWREADGLADAVAEATNLSSVATASEIAKPANRAWGGWDSHTGEAAPDGVTQISGEGGLLLGGGGGWTQVSSSAGSYWVLASTDPTICATSADGTFSITDPDGNAVMTVTKSDRRLVYATAGGITAGASSVVVQYSVASAEHPTCEMATDLNGAWYAEGDASAPFSVAWSGSSGAWVMTATAPSGGSFPKSGFFRATYSAGGDTVTAFGKGVRFDGGIVIGDTTYTVGTATVDGKTVLTLTAQ